MVLSKRSDRKDRKAAASNGKHAANATGNGATSDAATNGNGANGNGHDPTQAASVRTLDRDSNLRLQEELVRRNLVTEEQVDQAFSAQVDGGSDFGEVLVRMGFVSERDLFDDQGGALRDAGGRSSADQLRSRPSGLDP